ncbi:MAG: nucleotidyltransferase substrate binding protein [Planctomycetaceae bacterium]|jgi:hypothetical protein|nr:nucleotidyltransferase substrate binding protein [Planctomycetaceae bacterium]
MLFRNSDKLVRAMKSLEDTITYARTINFNELDNSYKSIIHAAVIQNFNLTFKICQKMLHNQLQNTANPTVADTVADTCADTPVIAAQFNTTPANNLNDNIESAKSLIHTAAKEGLISNPNNWLEYLDCEYLTNSSNSTVRTFEKAAAFLSDAKELLSTCTKRKYNERRAA